MKYGVGKYDLREYATARLTRGGRNCNGTLRLEADHLTY